MLYTFPNVSWRNSIIPVLEFEVVRQLDLRNEQTHIFAPLCILLQSENLRWASWLPEILAFYNHQCLPNLCLFCVYSTCFADFHTSHAHLHTHVIEHLFYMNISYSIFLANLKFTNYISSATSTLRRITKANCGFSFTIPRSICPQFN